ncbi:MAG: hypothetical protein GX613_02580 [Chloroflexi bacterium]|nr:hypothetical protein [Chloroflexota bacterium]
MTIFLLQTVTDRPVTVSTTVGQIITWIIIGLIAGLFANILIRGRGMSLTGLIVIGLIGSFVGGFLFSLIDLEPTGILGGELVIRWIDVVAAFFGALIIFALTSVWWRR